MLGRLALFLTVVGPGIITANVDNDAGGITTYSVAGASYGYSLLWTLIPITVSLVVVQEMSARMGAVTGKGLADLIRENFGVKFTVAVMIGLLIADLGNTVAEFAGIAASMEIYGVTKYISVPLSALFVWYIVLRGTYRSVEKIFLIASLFYVTYIISGILSKPDWMVVGKAFLRPSFDWSTGYLTMLIGVVGTTIAPWMQFYIQSAIVEKGITSREYAMSRLDVVIGCFTTDIVAAFIIIACGATLFAHGIQIETAKDAAISLAPLAGNWAANLFAFGLFNASMFSASILPLATAYYICEALGFEAGVNKTWDEAPSFYSLFTALIVAGAAIILIPHAPLIPIMVWSQVVNGALLPFILIFMLVLINDRKLMGAYTNSRAFNWVAWVTTVVMIVLTLMLVAITVRQILFT